MEPQKRSLATLLLLLSHLLTPTSGDFATACPTVCDCKWQSGNKAADCSEKELSTIPDNLSNEIQNLDLSGNPLYEITQSAFQSVGLSNLKKLILKRCNIQSIHKNGFSNLRIVIELDLSSNSIKTLHPDTFNDTEKVRWIYLNENKLEKIEDGLFKHLPYLQKVDLSHNHIFKLGLKSFVNLPKMQTLRLAYNNLTHMKLDTINSLESLTSLDLHNNPWKCDCNMQSFRDYVINKKLYTPPTSCAEPPQLLNRPWNEMQSGDFACRPSIIEPIHDTMLQAVGENVTLNCKVIGNPIPEVNWVLHSRIIDGDPKKHGDHRYIVKHSEEDLTKWVNLTITHVKYHDKGDYTCVAKNPGGVDEKTISLAVSKTGGGGAAGIAANDIMSMVIGITIGAIVLMILVGVLCFCFCRKRGSKRHIKSDMHSSNGDALIEGSVIPEMEKSLITTVNPVTKPPRIYDAPTSVMSGATEMSELNKTLLDNDSVFAANEDDSRPIDYAEQQPHRSREALLGDSRMHGSIGRPDTTQRAYPPDLLSFPPRGKQPSPASSSASTAPDTTRLPTQHFSPPHSPPYNPALFRTLPHSRSQSPFTPPTITPRQGYVTIPRRPRVPSWSSTAGSLSLQAVEYVEPVYDNLGLRTTADGSSVLSLNKAGLDKPFSPMRNRPLPATPTQFPPSRHNGDLSPAAEPQEPARRRRNAPETGSLKRIEPTLNDTRLYEPDRDTPSRSGKVPPRPPPKPKKKSPTTESEGPLFEDEGEDGTEV